MKIKTNDCIILTLSLMLLITSFGTSHANGFLAIRPTAETAEVTNLVSEDIARKIVLLEAQKKWPQFAIGNPILCCDDNVKLVAYMYPVKICDDKFPDDNTVFSRNTGPNKPKHGVDWGTGEYWTFVVSARERDFPVPCEFNALPSYFVTLPRAFDAAKKILGSIELTLSRYYFLGHRGEYFEFSSQDRTILIHAYSLIPYETKQILIRKGETENVRTLRLNMLGAKDRANLEIYQQQVQEEWDRIKREINR